MLDDLQVFGRRAPDQQPPLWSQSLLPPRNRVRAIHDARGLEEIHEQINEQLFLNIYAECEELHAQPVVISIDDQAGNAIAFREDEAITGRVPRQVRARRACQMRREACAPKSHGRWLLRAPA